MTMRTTTTPLLMLALACLAAGCSGDANQVAPVSFDTPPTTPAPPTTGVLSSPATTHVVAPTTQLVAPPDSTTPTPVDPVTTTDGVTGPMFSDALGVKVDSAPGVHTPGDTRELLPEGLYIHIAWQGDPNDLSVFTARTEDIPIIEAYANASLAYYTAFLSTRTTDAPEFDQYFVDGGAKYDRNFQEARDGGYVGSLGNGVVLRPYLLHDQSTPTTAILLDCYLQNQSYVLPDEPDKPGPIERSGTIASMMLVDGAWKVDLITTEPKACV